MRAYSVVHDEDVDVEAGFRVVRTFAWLYADYRDEYPLTRDVYAIPRLGREPAQSRIQYRGLDRDSLSGYADSDLDAEIHLELLEIDRLAVNGLVFARDDVEATFVLLGPLAPDYEIVWARLAGRAASPPDGYVSIGFEVSDFPNDHFSPSCDCMLFPRWHGTDEEGVLFLPHFARLNADGLFATPEAAQEFLDYYLSFDWTEHDNGGDYAIAEVFVQAAA
jgi:hypothetical protein